MACIIGTTSTDTIHSRKLKWLYYFSQLWYSYVSFSDNIHLILSWTMFEFDCRVNTFTVVQKQNFKNEWKSIQLIILLLKCFKTVFISDINVRYCGCMFTYTHLFFNSKLTSMVTFNIWYVLSSSWPEMNLFKSWYRDRYLDTRGVTRLI